MATDSLDHSPAALVRLTRKRSLSVSLTDFNLQFLAERTSLVLPLRFQFGLPNALKSMGFGPKRQRDGRGPRQAKVSAPERGRKSHVI